MPDTENNPRGSKLGGDNDSPSVPAHLHYQFQQSLVKSQQAVTNNVSNFRGILGGWRDKYTPYDVANFSSTMFFNSLCISVAMQPFNRVLSTIQKAEVNNLNFAYLAKEIPLKTMYRGFGAFASSGFMKGASSLTANQFVNSGGERTLLERTYAAMVLSQVEVLSSQALLNVSKLKAAGIIDPKFKPGWKSYGKLTALTWTPYSIVGLINFGGICIGADYFSNKMNFSSQLVNNFMGGAATGMFCATLGYIPSTIGDRKALATTVDSEGKLVTQSMRGFFKECRAHVQSRGFRNSCRDFAKTTIAELPVKNARAAVLFGVMKGVTKITEGGVLTEAGKLGHYAQAKWSELTGTPDSEPTQENQGPSK